MEYRNEPHRSGGKRVKKIEKRQKRPSRLTIQQKVLLVVAIMLTVAVIVVAVNKKLFVRPEIPTVERDPDIGTVIKTEESIDYGDGIRPKAGGERKSKDYYTVLILGRDTGGGGNTDTMLLASYDVTNQKATVMSIPRDTMVNVPWDIKKINSVYAWYGGGDKGIKAVYKEIAQLVGFEPDFQVVVEWDAIGEIVEAMDGVWFDVPYNMDYHDPYQDLVIEQAAGYRLLNGDDAMQVIRWRHNDDGKGYPDSDLGRIRTQQEFLKAVLKQLLQVKNIAKIGEFVDVFQNNVETDLSFQEMLWFGQQAVLGGLSLENVTFTTMPNKIVSAYSPTVSEIYSRDMYQSYVVPKANELLELVNNALSPFMEESALRDLDIMSVNKDGSVSSSTGYVEDKVAAKPPVKYSDQHQTPADEPVMDENGNVIDPETGEISETPGVGENDSGEPGTEELPPIDPGIMDSETGEPGTPEITPPESGTTVPDDTDPEPTQPEEPTPGAELLDPVTGELLPGAELLDPVTGEPLPVA